MYIQGHWGTSKSETCPQSNTTRNWPHQDSDSELQTPRSPCCPPVWVALSNSMGKLSMLCNSTREEAASSGGAPAYLEVTSRACWVLGPFFLEGTLFKRYKTASPQASLTDRTRNNFNEAQEWVILRGKQSRGTRPTEWDEEPVRYDRHHFRQFPRTKSDGKKQVLPVISLPVNVVLYFMWGLLHLAV